jgi:hypothetical protein
MANLAIYQGFVLNLDKIITAKFEKVTGETHLCVDFGGTEGWDEIYYGKVAEYFWAIIKQEAKFIDK